MTLEKAKRLWACLGNISDFTLEETETADISAETAARRKKIIQYSTLAAVASFGIALTLFIVRAKRGASRHLSA